MLGRPSCLHPRLLWARDFSDVTSASCTRCHHKIRVGRVAFVGKNHFGTGKFESYR